MKCGVTNITWQTTNGVFAESFTYTVWGYVDSQNDVVARWQYDAWGNVIAEDVSVPALASLRYRFQSREWSAATGLINFRMRWYDPETGRWLSKDPIGLSGGLNLYVFCLEEPNDIRDMFGTCPFDDKQDASPFMDFGAVSIMTGGLIIAGASNATLPGHLGATVTAVGWIVGGAIEGIGLVSTFIGIIRGEKGPTCFK